MNVCRHRISLCRQIFFVLPFLFLPSLPLSAQEAESVNGISIIEPEKEVTEPESTESGGNTEKKPQPPVTAQSKPVKNYNVSEVKSGLEKQFLRAPEDPSFMYETRFIPGLEDSGEFLSQEVEQEVIVDTIEANKQKFKIVLPNLTQILIVGGIILLFALYRMRVRKMRNSRRG